MIKAESKNSQTTTEIYGNGKNILMEFSSICRALMDSGIEEEELIIAMAMSKEMEAKQSFHGEDAKLAHAFMIEIARRVEEKRNAQKDEGHKHS